MKFGGHETFHLRDNWIHKGLNFLAEGKDLSDNDNAIEVLGLGNNMVNSVRYWLRAAGLVDRKDATGWAISSLGKSLLKFDPFFERIGTSWLIHYNLASNEQEATTWYWFFNKFGVSEFSEESALHYLEAYVFGKGRKISTGTLRRDVQALLRSYVPQPYRVGETPEDSIVSPLVSLGLLRSFPGGYRLQAPDPERFPVEIFLIALIQFWSGELKTTDQVVFDELVTRDGSPFKALLLNSDNAFVLLNRTVEKFPGHLTYSKAGGFFSVSLKSRATAELFRSYYKVT